ncbi:MAG: hypothetical protein E6Q41_01525 [Cyclobacteriaceae bacterium]|nr:MAG: hypothetical protein E6Q41_01525 [Cyclobacteriaceae bacterium]
MSYDINKTEVLDLFDNHIIKYIVKDLVHSQKVRPVDMSFTELINNDTYFPEIKQYSSCANFLTSFRDNLRSIMAHRFLLAKYDITKSNIGHLFFEESGRQIFNVSHFTKMTVAAIRTIYNKINEDSFIINGYSKELTMEKIKEKIDELRDYEGKAFSHLTNLPSSTTTTQTTSSLG